MPRAQVNNSARSQMAALAKFRDLLNGSIVTGGTVNAQTFTSGVGYTVVPTGMRVMLKIGPLLTNTGATTLNMDSIADVAIKDQLGLDLIGDELVADGYKEFLYDGTNWRLIRDVGGYVMLDKQDATGLTEVEFTGLTDAYREYTIVGTNLQPNLNDKQMSMQFSIDDGATFISGASDYMTVTVARSSASGSGALNATVASASEFAITGSMADAPSSSRGNFNTKVFGMGADFDPSIMNTAMSFGSVAGLIWYTSVGLCPAAVNANAIRFFLEGGAGFLHGTIAVYGLRE